MLGLTLLGLATAAPIWLARWQAFSTAGALAIDYRTFVDEGHRILSSGTPYLPYQLAGPYGAAPAQLRQPADVPFLYPPPFALVTVALLVVPWPVWWVLPIGLLAYLVASWRPAPWTWPIIALCLVWPQTPSVLVVGGSALLMAALIGAALRWGVGPLILLKPSMLPLAVLGLGRRGWWLAAGAFGVAGLLTLPLWPQWIEAMRNATGLGYALGFGDVPLFAIPVVAWLGRATPDVRRRTPS